VSRKRWRASRILSVVPLLTGLSKAWTAAAAALPLGWRLMGVATGPRVADPATHSGDEWCAWARGPNGEKVEGRGAVAEQALNNLATRLREDQKQ
jgi:hypothetical protein